MRLGPACLLAWLVLWANTGTTQTGFLQNPAMPKTACAVGRDDLGFQRLTVVDRAVPGPDDAVTLVLDGRRPVAFIVWGTDGVFDSAIFLTSGLIVQSEDLLNQYLRRIRDEQSPP